MVIGLLRLRLHIPAARSLKDRRAVVRKALDRVRARFPVSAAEVGDTARWQLATLAAVTVSHDAALVREVLDKVSAAVASAVAGSAELLRRELRVDAYNDDEPMGDEEGFDGDREA
jgi:uncharacterized protein YlxP (DUF503 family)